MILRKFKKIENQLKIKNYFLIKRLIKFEKIYDMITKKSNN